MARLATAEDDDKDIDMASNARMWSELFGGNSLVDGRSNTEAVMDAIRPGAGLLNVGGSIADEEVVEEQSLLDSLLSPGGISKPVSPLELARQNHGDGFGFEMKRLIAGQHPTLTSLLMPELSASNIAQYKADMELYNEYRKEAMVDPQNQALAAGIRNGVVGPELMALQVEASGADPLSMDQATLSPGQIRYDAFGNVVAKGGDPVINDTAVIQNATSTADGYGIKRGTPAFSDLVAAYAEPSGTQTLADGTVVPFNTVDKVLADWKNGYYDQTQGQPRQAGQAQPQQGQANQVSGVGSDGSVSPEGARDATIRKTMNAEEAENLKIADQKISFYNDLQGVMSNFGEWDPEANDGAGGFTVNEATLDNYGSWQNHPLNPGAYEFFKGSDEKDSLVYIDQLVDMLTVDERGKLKGQGQITEGETAMLKRAVTSLQNRNLSDAAVKREMEKLMRGLIERRKKFMDLQSTYGPKGHGDGSDDIIDLDAN